MGCVRQANRQEACRFFKIFVLKFLLGLTDVITDCVNGHNFLTRQFLLGLYFASQRREEYDLVAGSTAAWGYQTICLPWLPGLFRISFIASEVKWRSLQCKEVLLNIGGYILMLLAWPLFSPLM